MTVTLLKRLAMLAALVCLSATLNSSAVGAQESRPGSEAALAGDQTPEQQITRLYGAVLGRSPDSQGLAFWINDLTSGNRTLTQIADAMVSVTPEFSDRYGNLDNRAFVNQLYLNVQGRPGETGGLNFWTGELDSNNRTRGGVVLGFSESVEYRVATGSTDPLDRLYCAFFLRNPDPSGTIFYRDQYLVAERSLNNIAQEFTQSTEFTSLYGSLSERQFVELIYRNVLGRDLPLTEVGGPAFWTSELTSGARTRGQVMVEFSESTEYGNLWTRGAPCPAPGEAVAEAANDTATVNFVGSVVVDWSGNDTAPAGTTVTFTQGANGTVTNNNNGTFTYTRNANEATTDSFTYTLTLDGQASTATVNITILPAGTDASAVADRFVIKKDEAFAMNVLANDTATGRTLSLPSATSAEGGTLAIVGQNVRYTPADGYTLGRNELQVLEPDTFTYTLTETATGTTSTASVEVVVLAEPECEVFMNYPFGAVNGVGGDNTEMELFFSSEACVTVYDQSATFDVNWNNVTINEVSVTTTDSVSSVLQEFVTITPSTDPVTVEGQAVLTVNGTPAVTIEFRLEFTTPDGGTTWSRTVATYKGRDEDVTINVPLVPTCITDNTCNS